jgi:2-C-methyl-D-erythritol 4-phosphate cytidylyltransferase
MEKYAVIVAGGSGERMGAAMPKQFLLLNGKPLLWYSITAFLSCYADIHIILVLPAEHLETGKKIIDALAPHHPILLTEGGVTRFNSVQNGLQLIKEDGVIFVHDAVRCLISKELIERCYTQALLKGSAIPAVQATDSIRIVDDEGHHVVDRKRVCIIQTPQTFLSTLLLPAFTVAYNDLFTDEATVVEASGKAVFLIEGDYNNLKITRPADMVIAENILAGLSAFTKQ